LLIKKLTNMSTTVSIGEGTDSSPCRFERGHGGGAGFGIRRFRKAKRACCCLLILLLLNLMTVFYIAHKVRDIYNIVLMSYPSYPYYDDEGIDIEPAPLNEQQPPISDSSTFCSNFCSSFCMNNNDIDCSSLCSTNCLNNIMVAYPEQSFSSDTITEDDNNNVIGNNNDVEQDTNEDKETEENIPETKQGPPNSNDQQHPQGPQGPQHRPKKHGPPPPRI
jgi:hypothetical protein